MKVSRKKLKITGLLLIILILIIGSYIYFRARAYYADKNNILHYPLNRGKIDFTILSTNETQSFTEQKIKFVSKEISIYGLLYTPKINQNKLPAIVILPGGGVKKEDEARVARFAANHGYVALTIDQRGIGETDSIFPSIDYDYQTFLAGKEPVLHLVIFDALRTVDLVRQLPLVDRNKVVLMGESMGGRFSIIASAIDKSIYATIIVSSSGYGNVKTNNEEEQQFIDSINPSHYIAMISPREIIFMHGQNDTTISLQMAQQTYALAKEPKKFIYVENCGHGLCDNMLPYFAEELERLKYSHATPTGVMQD